MDQSCATTGVSFSVTQILEIPLGVYLPWERLGVEYA